MFVKIGGPEKIISIIKEEVKLSEPTPFYISKDSSNKKLSENESEEKNNEFN